MISHVGPTRAEGPSEWQCIVPRARSSREVDLHDSNSAVTRCRVREVVLVDEIGGAVDHGSEVEAHGVQDLGRRLRLSSGRSQMDSKSGYAPGNESRNLSIPEHSRYSRQSGCGSAWGRSVPSCRHSRELESRRVGRQCCAGCQGSRSEPYRRPARRSHSPHHYPRRTRCNITKGVSRVRVPWSSRLRAPARHDCAPCKGASTTERRSAHMCASRYSAFTLSSQYALSLTCCWDELCSASSSSRKAFKSCFAAATSPRAAPSSFVRRL